MDFIAEHPFFSLIILLIALSCFFGAERVGSTIGDYAHRFYEGASEGVETAYEHAVSDGGISVESH